MDFDSIDDAAFAALQNISEQKHARRREYIALIYQDPNTGKYRFTEPATSGKKGSAKGTFRVPAGSLRAIIHNHPEGDRNRDKLSTQDVGMARRLGVASYIGVDGRLFSWDPKAGRMGEAGRGIPVEVLADELAGTMQ